MDKYVPKDVGELRDNVSKTADSITYESPHAHYQYVNQFPKDHYTTPGTGPYWDKKMWTAEGEDVVREVQEYANRGK